MQNLRDPRRGYFEWMVALSMLSIMSHEDIWALSFASACVSIAIGFGILISTLARGLLAWHYRNASRASSTS